MSTILCIVAHPDDEIVGMGGTILKYLDESKKVITIIFSYGEKSHPHLKEKIIKKTREGETKKLDELLKRKSIFLGLTEGKITQEAEEKKVRGKLAKLIQKYKPAKIFTHNANDPHPDHRAVHQVVKDVVENIKYKRSFLTFEVWNITNENAPVVYVDISDYFKKKLELMKIYESQKHFIYILLLPIILRAWNYGRKNNCKYAERFYKLK
ncbi:MAG: PIG-L family deacetylase [Nanoarchaeota archaeon]|nr:PIG-L family deacetylase [Nanoarchaeota archaeon]MCG2718712.1 PIG-L family deacetylase [Nanoarchaeota archaeon]